MSEALKAREKAVEESQESMDIILSTIRDQIEQAHDKGPEHVMLIFTTIAYALGTHIPFSVEDRSFANMQMQLIRAMGNGIQTGMQMTGSKSSMTMVVRDL